MAKIFILELAKKLGKTALEIADETGLNRNTVGALFRGDTDVRLSTIEKICQTYDVSLNEVLEIEHGLNRSKEEVLHNFPEKVYKQEGEVIPFTCWPWISIAGTYFLNKKNVKYQFGVFDMYFKGDYGEIYWDYAELYKLASAFYEEYSDVSQYMRLYRKYLVYATEIEDTYLHLKCTKSTSSSSSILELFDRVRVAYDSFWETSLFIDAFDTGVDQEKIAKIAEEYGFTKQEVQVLTTPIEPTFADERKFALLSLIKSFVGRQREVTKENIDSFMKRNSVAIEKYCRQFDYHKSNYVDIKHITLDEIFNEIDKYSKDRLLFNEEYERLEKYVENKQKEISNILKSYRLKTNPLGFFQHITYWREHRKKVNLMGIHVLDHILISIEELTGIPRKYLQYLSFDEVENVLNGLIPVSVLCDRRENGVLVNISGDKYKFFIGNESLSIRGDLEAILSGKTEKTILTGQTASHGYAKGPARVILAQKDFDQFKEGEVLVTSMTRPEFVPLMKIAAGIVTNEGGITCHAAIVSRELGKPCVIGTKTATQFIKTGDLVEVRANHATVRVLKRA
jgi:phosphoenolpyruvate synthase/pyruvate phosphate dikinase